MNVGLRYRNNSYILSTLDERGEYAPTYLDGQCYLTWDPDGYGPWELQALGVYGRNDYSFLPATRETNIGTVNQAARLTVYYDGREESGYETGFGALAAERRTEQSRIRFIQSVFQTAERESFDVLGQYFLSELERDPGGDTFDEGQTFGVGGFLQHGRNQLWARVVSSALKGSHILEQHHVEWGIKHRIETFDDVVSEWNVVDSAGFFAPHPADNLGYLDPADRPNQIIALPYYVSEHNLVSAHRSTAFVQDTWTRESARGDLRVHVGARVHRWSVLTHPEASTRNTHVVGGPRANVSFVPASMAQTVLRVSGGYYYQPPFYREMRGLDGRVRDDVAPQRAIHAVAGVDHEFSSKGRPFKFVGELFWKDLDNLIPYEIENVRQRYYATNNASGYATGVDMMLNGEFIPGIQSWLAHVCAQNRGRPGRRQLRGVFQRRRPAGRAGLPQRPVCHHHRHRGGASWHDSPPRGPTVQLQFALSRRDAAQPGLQGVAQPLLWQRPALRTAVFQQAPRRAPHPSLPPRRRGLLQGLVQRRS